MLVDTHTHLQMDAFDADREAVLQRARDHGVERLVVIGIDLPSSRAACDLAAAHPGMVYATVGVHPHDAASLDDAALGELRELAARPGVVAIGEIGLDFYRDRCPRAVQHDAFRRQVALALELGLPIVIHSRESLPEIDEDLVESDGYDTRVLMHCFTTRPDLVGRFVERGCWLGLGGPVSYPKAADAHAVAATAPLERLVVETDCPYLAPQAFRGKRCEPWHVRLAAEAIAAQRAMALEELAAATTANAASFFGW